jgi:hypothetical protein
MHSRSNLSTAGTLFGLVWLLAGTWAVRGAAEKTVVNDPAAAQALAGHHRLSLQWISWEKFGSVTITNDAGLFRIRGHQTELGVGDIAKNHRAMSTGFRPTYPRITTLRGEMVDIKPTGGRQELWLEVEVVRYDIHPCVDGKGRVGEQWRGWLKAVDNQGYPNLWYSTRGC